MPRDENGLRQDLVRWGRSLFERRFTVGSSGNISVKLDEGFLVTPTNSCLGFLDAERLSKLDAAGRHLSGDNPTKELSLHMGFYEGRPSAEAVVHLHSTYATALSCLSDINQQNALAPITPYAVMRVGPVPVLPYTRPGSSDIAPLIRGCAADSSAVLLANHGPVLAAPSLDGAIFAIEELEETAKLILLTHGMAVRFLDNASIADLDATFKLR